VTNNGTNWANGNPKRNAISIDFPTATGAWTTANHFAILNHATNSNSSNVIFYGALGTAKTIASGETPKFAINALAITAD
jgi:hypothetical protein